MKIAVVSPLFPVDAEPYRGLPIYNTVLALQQFADVEVLCPKSTYPRLRMFQPRVFRYSRVAPGFSPPGVRTQYIEYPAFPVLTRGLNAHSCARRLLPYLKQAQPDVVLAYYVYPEGYGALMAAEGIGRPAVLGARGYDLNVIPDPFTRYWTKRAMRRAAFVLTVSEELRRKAISFGARPEHVRTVLNGCDASVFHPADRSAARAKLGVRPETQLVLYVGRLERLKGAADLVDAFLCLAGNHPRLELACIGEDFMHGRLQDLVARAGYGDRVRFLGTRTSPEIAHWISATNLFSLPSYSEGCPNAVLEALSCGRPVVGTTVGAIPDVVDSTCGRLVSQGDVRGLTAALADALEHPWDEADIARRFGRSWETVAQETYEVCQAVAQQSGKSERLSKANG